MGQYHITVNLTKREFIHPHKLGDGLKLREQLWATGGIQSALLLLLAASNGRGGGDFAKDEMIGRWAGDRIAVIGDYAEPGDFRRRRNDPLAGELYGLCGESNSGWTDISELVIPVLERECEVKITSFNKCRLTSPFDKSFGVPEVILSFNILTNLALQAGLK